MKLDTGAPYSTLPLSMFTILKKSDDIKVLKWFDSEKRPLFRDILVSDHNNKWHFYSNMTGRNGTHGLLGIDFLLKVKPLIVYVDDKGVPFDMAGQRKDIDFLEQNVIRFE